MSLILNYTAEDDDIKFLIYCIDTSAAFVKSDSIKLVLNDLSEITSLDEIVAYIFTSFKEEVTSKKILEFKKLRKAPITPKIEINVLNIVCFINLIKSTIKLGTLKHKEALDSFSKKLNEHYAQIYQNDGCSSLFFDYEFFLLELRAGKIVEIDTVEGLDKIYCEKVRSNVEYTICSGLRHAYQKDDLLGKTFLFLLNIKKAKFKHLESQGMICCTSEKDPCIDETVSEVKIRIEALNVNAPEGSLIQLENHISLFEDIEYAKVDFSKTSYKNVFAGFKISDHHLVFKERKVLLSNDYVKTKIAHGPVS